MPVDEYDFVAFADQDDIWNLDKLDRATWAIRLRQVDAYSSNVTAFWADGRACLLDKGQPQVAWDYLFEAAGPGCTYVMRHRLMTELKASMLANWEALQQVRLHDWYCYAYARSHGFRWFIDPLSSMQYRQHAQNQVGEYWPRFIDRALQDDSRWLVVLPSAIDREVGGGRGPCVCAALAAVRSQTVIGIVPERSALPATNEG